MLYYDTMNGDLNANLAGAYEVCLSDRDWPVGRNGFALRPARRTEGKPGDASDFQA
jgi:hypothetical protein